MISETKPRKAKYGFKLYLGPGTLKLAAILYSVLQNVDELDDEPAYWTETPNRMGTSELLLYINNDDLYAKVKTALAADEIVQPKLTLALPIYCKHPNYYVEVASDEVEGDERIVCIAIGKHDPEPDQGRTVKDILKDAAFHLYQHMRGYHHVSPPELLEEIKKVIA